MTSTSHVLTPDECVAVLIDHQAGLAFAVESIDRQTLLNNTVALGKAAQSFGMPTILLTSAIKVYSGRLMPDIRSVVPNAPVLDRRNTNAREDEAIRAVVIAAGRRRIMVSGV